MLLVARVVVLLAIVLSQKKCESGVRGEDALPFLQRRTDRPKLDGNNKTLMLYPEFQIPATVQPGNVSQFYYLNHRDGTPLTILVTPCAGQISWTVTSFEPPDDNHPANEETRTLARWPVESLIPGSPLFSYDGDEAQNFTIPRVRAGLYRLDIKTSVDSYKKDTSPKTVLLYATSSALDHLPISYENSRGKRHRALRFQPRRNRRRLTVSWSKSHVDPHLSSYCLAVTSGSSVHPPTLCAAKNILQAHSKPTRGGSSKEHQHRGPPEGLHCVHQTRLTLHGLKYNTTYNFTLYIVSKRNNVSTRVAAESLKFRKTPAQILRTGRYVTAKFLKNDGFINFRYRPQHNGTTEFHVFSCGGGIVRAKLRGPGINKKEVVVGHLSLKAPSLEPGKRYTLRISATPQELIEVPSVKVLAIQEGSITYPKVESKSKPHEYPELRRCHEVTIGVESAGSAKYCILVRKLRGSTPVTEITSIPDQCGLHRRRRSEFVNSEQCEDRVSLSENRALLFTVPKLQPGKTYLLQITAQTQGQTLSYPLIGVRTERSCQLKNYSLQSAL